MLHAPTECEYCDGRPDLQRLRDLWAINFTGHDDRARSQCPAEKARGLESLYAWGGNRPKPTVAGWATALAAELWAQLVINSTRAEWNDRATKAIVAALANAPVV